MAIDTAARRSACLDFEWICAEAVPRPDGAIWRPDRIHLLWSYFLQPASTGDVYIVSAEDRVYVPEES